LRKSITFDFAGEPKGIAWLSFQPDGSISCGLRDRTYVSPRFRDRIGLWNAYNRVGIEYLVANTPNALESVDGAHITFHPPLRFHFKGRHDRSQHDEDIFQGIAEVGIMLAQQAEVPWLRMVSKSLSQLPQAGASRPDRIDSEELVFTVPAPMIAASALIEIDFIRESDIHQDQPGPPWEFRWHEVGLRVRPRIIAPQIATLSWFHFY
jgi:hypothetical protein